MTPDFPLEGELVMEQRDPGCGHWDLVPHLHEVCLVAIRR